MAKLDPIAEFREDHRKVRDGLLDIIVSLQAKNVVKEREVLGGLDEAGKSMGLKTFLTESVDDQILFI